MLCTVCIKQVIPCIHSLTTTNACDDFQQARKKCLFIVQPFQQCGQRSYRPRHPCKDSFLVHNDESIPKLEWTPGPQTGRWKRLWTTSPMPSSIDLSTPPPMVTLLIDQSKVMIQPMKDGDGKRTFELGPIITMSCHPQDSNTKVKQNPPKPPQQDSPVPCLPCEKTPWQPTPGPSGTQWLEDLFRKPSQHDEPRIPCPIQPSKPHEDASTCGPEPHMAPTQSKEETFATPAYVIIIDDMPVGSPLPLSAPENPGAKLPSFPQ
ncbi:hypothetical protein O181_123292 [Austropuccinia psidii MF-1]|uniref:Uncharacterized protein n=1 Tax=Austropuccinia psidii MF-1 TaxID=1389203 RepID=A0A9Q3KPS1_9BASI|nr:hypothetical protein [Austropuccinia psidii MF-1]